MCNAVHILTSLEKCVHGFWRSLPATLGQTQPNILIPSCYNHQYCQSWCICNINIITEMLLIYWVLKKRRGGGLCFLVFVFAKLYVTEGIKIYFNIRCVANIVEQCHKKLIGVENVFDLIQRIVDGQIPMVSCSISSSSAWKALLCLLCLFSSTLCPLT